MTPEEASRIAAALERIAQALEADRVFKVSERDPSTGLVEGHIVRASWEIG